MCGQKVACTAHASALYLVRCAPVLQAALLGAPSPMGPRHAPEAKLSDVHACGLLGLLLRVGWTVWVHRQGAEFPNPARATCVHICARWAMAFRRADALVGIILNGLHPMQGRVAEADPSGGRGLHPGGPMLPNLGVWPGPFLHNQVTFLCPHPQMAPSVGENMPMGHVVSFRGKGVPSSGGQQTPRMRGRATAHTLRGHPTYPQGAPPGQDLTQGHRLSPGGSSRRRRCFLKHPYAGGSHVCPVRKPLCPHPGLVVPGAGRAVALGPARGPGAGQHDKEGQLRASHKNIASSLPTQPGRPRRTQSTRPHVSGAGGPPRQSLTFKKRLTMYYS